MFQICLNLFAVASYKQPNAPDTSSATVGELMENGAPKVISSQPHREP